SVMSELDRDAVLVPLHNREAEQRRERPYEEDVDEDRDARHRRLEDDGADALDIRGNRVAVAQEMDDRLMRCGRRKLVEPVEHRREEEPGQEQHGDQMLDVPEEDVRNREHTDQAQGEAQEREEEREGERHGPGVLRHDVERERNEDPEDYKRRDRLGEHDGGGDELAGEPDLLDQIRTGYQRRRTERHARLEEGPHGEAGEDEQRIVGNVAGAAPENREDEGVDAHHREREEKRPHEPQRRSLVASPELAAQKRAQELAVPRQPRKARENRRPRLGGGGIHGHEGQDTPGL